MLSPALTRGSLVDALVPGVSVRSDSSAPARRIALLSDLAFATLGGLLIALCLWLDTRAVLHQPITLGGAIPLDARTVTADVLLALGAVALVAVGTRFHTHALARDTALVIGGALLLALCAHISIPTQPVPITGQTFAVLLLAAALGWRRGLTTVTLYIVLGTAGLPVFADVSTPLTYGYLAGFALAALVVGWLAEHGWDRRLASSIAAMLLGEVAIFALGVSWLAHFIGWRLAVAGGLTPFLIGDIIKLALAAALLPGAWLLVGRSNKSNGRLAQ